MKIARVFPRRTKATPDDDLAFVGEPDMFMRPGEVDEVHVSIAFTWDWKRGNELADAWLKIAPVFIGGPATGEPAGEFVPGRYLRHGFTITSRGCPNHCKHCFVPKRDGAVRELPIHEGWIVQDDNLLACSEKHVLAVFDMLRRQKQPVEFSGGFEARRFQPWHAEALRSLRLYQVFFAYDKPGDFEPLAAAAEICWRAGFKKGTTHSIRAYVLIGYDGDTFDAATMRLEAVLKLGVIPFAMLFRDETHTPDKSWKKFLRQWARPTIICAKVKAA